MCLDEWHLVDLIICRKILLTFDSRQNLNLYYLEGLLILFPSPFIMTVIAYFYIFICEVSVSLSPYLYRYYRLLLIGSITTVGFNALLLTKKGKCMRMKCLIERT